MAALAVGLASLRVALWHPAGVGAAGAVKGDQPADGLLGLATPDAVLLSGPHRERQAVVTHRAGGADGDGLELAVGGVGEERVVVGRDDVAARGLVAPAAQLGHAAAPSCGRLVPAARLAWRALAAARERRVK